MIKFNFQQIKTAVGNKLTYFISFFTNKNPGNSGQNNQSSSTTVSSSKVAIWYIRIFWVLFVLSPLFLYKFLLYIETQDNTFGSDIRKIYMFLYIGSMIWYLFKSFLKGTTQQRFYLHLWGMPVASLPMGFSPRFSPYKLVSVEPNPAGDIEIYIPGEKKDIDYDDKPEMAHGKIVKALRMPVNDNDNQEISLMINGVKKVYNFITAPVNRHTATIDPYRQKMVLAPIFQAKTKIPETNIEQFFIHYTDQPDAIASIIAHITAEAMTVFSKKTFATLAANQDLVEEYLKDKFSLSAIDVVSISIIDFGIPQRVAEEAANLISTAIKNQETLQTAETEAISERKGATTAKFVTKTNADAQAYQSEKLNKVELKKIKQLNILETKKINDQQKNVAKVKAFEEKLFLEAQGDGLKRKAKKLGVDPKIILTMDTLMEFAKNNPNILLNVGSKGGSTLEGMITQFLMNNQKTK